MKRLMIGAAAAGLGLLAALTATAAQKGADAKGGAMEIVAPGARVEKVAGGCKFTEGPAADAEGNVFFSDGPNNRIMKLAPDGTVTVFKQPSMRANGMLFDSQGRLVTCNAASEGGGRSVTRYERDGKVTVLADRYQGKRLNSPNDLAIDRQGRIYFTDPRYGDRAGMEQDRMAVYRIERDGSLTRVIDDVQTPNGILITPDNRTLYLADNNPDEGGARTLLAYDIRPDDTVRRRAVLYDLAPGRGIDGMVLDRQGNLYATAGLEEKTGVYVFSPDGKLLTFIRTPETATNCTFGGKDLRTLYISAGESLYRIRTQIPGQLVYPR